MKAITTAVALLLLAGCNRSAAPDATANKAANTAAPAAAPAAAAPAVDRALMIGRWTDNGDCSVATDFAEDGQFRTSSGAGGQWTLAGDRLTLSGETTLTVQVIAIDRNTIELVNSDGSRGRSTRC